MNKITHITGVVTVVATLFMLLLVGQAFGRSTQTHHYHHSRFTPDLAAVNRTLRVLPARYRPLMRCVAYDESRYELGVSSGSSFGPWEVDPTYHPWANTYRLTHSWSYNAYAIHRISWHPPRNGYPGYYDFSAWRPDCGI